MATNDAANCANPDENETPTLITLKISKYHENLKKFSGDKVNELKVSKGFQNLFVAVWNVNLHFLMFSAGQNAFYICVKGLY